MLFRFLAEPPGSRSRDKREERDGANPVLPIAQQSRSANLPTSKYAKPTPGGGVIGRRPRMPLEKNMSEPHH